MEVREDETGKRACSLILAIFGEQFKTNIAKCMHSKNSLLAKACCESDQAMA